VLAFVIWSVLVLTLVWVVLGYPAYVVRAAARHPMPIRVDGAFTPRVTILMAVRNGGQWLERKLASIVGQEYPTTLLDVVVVSDGSTDETDAIVTSHRERGLPIALIRQEPAGKAAALSLAMPQLSGEVVVLTDARQELHPRCVRELVSILADPGIGAVSGQLLPKDAGDGSDQTAGPYWRMETRLRLALGTLDSMLGATGPIYAMRRADLRPVPKGLILDDMYLPLGAFFSGKRLVSAPDAIAWEEAMPLASEFHRKVRTAAGNYQLLKYEPRLLSPTRNRMFWHYLSYKLGRLLLPHLLIAEAAAALFLPDPFRAIVLGGHALVVLLVLVDGILPTGTILRRVTSPLRSFSSLIYAAFVAQRVFISGTAGLWVPTGTRK
jgi:poly-beta-1,6-N-acetyl-D-glucosamine synthase